MNKQIDSIDNRQQQTRLDMSNVCIYIYMCVCLAVCVCVFIYIFSSACPKPRVPRGPYNDAPFWATSSVDICITSTAAGGKLHLSIGAAVQAHTGP